MTSKAAEQLVDVVQQARQIVDVLPPNVSQAKEPHDMNERAIRFYIQSCQNERVCEYFECQNACVS